MVEMDSVSDNHSFVAERTDKYFSKTRRTVERFGDKHVTYGVFLRRVSICAIEPALSLLRRYYEAEIPLEITRYFDEGSIVPAEKPIFSYSGSFVALAELETLLLQKIGMACVSAHNAYLMAMAMPRIAFMDMHARHACGDDMSEIAAYGAGVGNRLAKLMGAKGFIGSSQDLTAPSYGQVYGMGTMPHALIGYAGSTLEATKMFIDANPDDKNVTVLVDYFGKEYTDSVEVAKWFYSVPPDSWMGRSLGVRLDTHGGRYAEGLDYQKSVGIVCDWLHASGEFEAVRIVMGDEAFEQDIANVAKDRCRKLLFGPGVSAANVIKMRQVLDQAAYHNVKIVASSGFNPFKVKTFGRARVPVDMIGTGSFLPETLAETFATADIYRYGGEASIKVGRESIFKDVM